METGALTTFRAERRLADWEDTRTLGSVLAHALAEGGALLLEGPLGVGKTALTKALCAGLGVTGEVTSPTFDLLHVYAGRGVTVYHVDGYRIEDPREWEVLDLPASDEPGVVLVGEWSQDLQPFYPERLEVKMGFDADGARRVQVQTSGEHLSPRIHEGWERVGWVSKS